MKQLAFSIYYGYNRKNTITWRWVYAPGECTGGCSDIGDLGTLMPILHPMIGGAEGHSHGSDYRINDPDTACVKSAQIQLLFLGKILGEDTTIAKQAVAAYKPLFSSKEEYFAYIDGVKLDRDAVAYQEDGTVTLSFQ